MLPCSTMRQNKLEHAITSKCLQESLRPMEECLQRLQSLASCYRLLYTSSTYHLLVGIYIAAAPEWLKVYSRDEIKVVNTNVYKCANVTSLS